MVQRILNYLIITISIFRKINFFKVHLILFLKIGEIMVFNKTPDEVDLSILSMLRDDARVPFTKIAKHLGISDATIHIRVNKMEKMGLIKKYTTILDDEMLGKLVISYFLIRVKPGTIGDVCKKLLELDEIYEISEIHERYDLLIKVKGHDLTEIRDILIDKIRSIADIVDSEILTVYKIWK